MNRAAELAVALGDDDDVEALAERFNGTLARARDHRWGTPVGAIGSAPGLDEAVFTGGEGSVVGPIRVGERGAAVARIETLRLLGPDEMEAERGPARARLLAQRAQQLLIAIVNERRRDTVVTADEEFRMTFQRQG
jgi:hypothetical protein